MGSLPTGGSTWKNIAIGVFTTVAAYAIINFIGIGKKDNSKKIHKEATIKAWEAVNDYISYADQKFMTIACFSCDEQEMKNEMLRELDNYSAKLANIKEDKNVDNKMLSIIDIIKQRLTDFKTPYRIFFDKITETKKSFFIPQATQTNQAAKFQNDLHEGMTRIINRDSAEFRNFLNDVNTTYKLNLKEESNIYLYEAAALVGKWRIECVVDVEFKKDGKLMWIENNYEYPGNWTLKDKLLTLNLKNGQVLKYYIQHLNSKFLLIEDYQNSLPFSLGACPQ